MPAIPGTGGGGMGGVDPEGPEGKGAGGAGAKGEGTVGPEPLPRGAGGLAGMPGGPRPAEGGGMLAMPIGIPLVRLGRGGGAPAWRERGRAAGLLIGQECAQSTTHAQQHACTRRDAVHVCSDTLAYLCPYAQPTEYRNTIHTSTQHT